MNTMKLNVSRDTVLDEAIHNCLCEMYAKAQPAADWNNIVAEYQSGKIKENENIGDRHYLSADEYLYILNKYMDAYRIRSEWRDNVDLVSDFLKTGGSKRTYKNDEETDETIDPLNTTISNIVDKYVKSSDDQSCAVKDIVDACMNLIDECKYYYRLNNDECRFRLTLAIGASPTSNKDTVIKWWKDNYNVDINIEEHNPLLFWEYDHYGDQIDDIMTDEYGDNWKEIIDQQWKEQKT